MRGLIDSCTAFALCRAACMLCAGLLVGSPTVAACDADCLAHLQAEVASLDAEVRALSSKYVLTGINARIWFSNSAIGDFASAIPGAFPFDIAFRGTSAAGGIAGEKWTCQGVCANATAGAPSQPGEKGWGVYPVPGNLPSGLVRVQSVLNSGTVLGAQYDIELSANIHVPFQIRLNPCAGVPFSYSDTVVGKAAGKFHVGLGLRLGADKNLHVEALVTQPVSVPVTLGLLRLPVSDQPIQLAAAGPAGALASSSFRPLWLSSGSVRLPDNQVRSYGVRSEAVGVVAQDGGFAVTFSVRTDWAYP